MSLVAPRQLIEPMSPALAGGFLTTASPGKSLNYLSYGIRLDDTQQSLLAVWGLWVGRIGLGEGRWVFLLF